MIVVTIEAIKYNAVPLRRFLDKSYLVFSGSLPESTVTKAVVRIILFLQYKFQLLIACNMAELLKLYQTVPL